MQSKSLKQTKEIAEKFLEKQKSQSEATVVALIGDLGSGKTTFVQCVANLLGISETITSPTFVIEKIYELKNREFKHIVHIDAYRLEGEEELRQLGWNDIVKDSKNLIFIEWADRVEDILPKTHTRIDFKFIDETTRDIVVTYVDEK